jgi:ABC-2 type transport system ATP-binding protein
VPGVRSVELDPTAGVTVHGSGPLLARVAHALVERGIEPMDLRAELPTLEDAYLVLTGADAGDAPPGPPERSSAHAGTA